MKKEIGTRIIFICAGLVISYCFTSMVKNAKIVSPFMVWHNRALTLDSNELYAGLKDFEIKGENIIRSTTDDSWVEIMRIRERIGRVRTVICRIKTDANDITKAELFYADAEQEYNSNRRFTAEYKDGSIIIEIPPYAGPIDKLRLDLTALEGVTIEIKEISLNADAGFSWLIFAFIYVVWLFLVPHPNPPPTHE